MRAWRRVILLFAITTVPVVALTATTAEASGLCLPVRAQGAGTATGPTTANGTISVGRVVVATTEAGYVPGSLEGDVLTIAGEIVITTRFGLGTLTVSVTGPFNLTTGAFDVAGPVSASTGLLAGTTGNLRFVGVQDAQGNFTETVTGRLCAARRSAGQLAGFTG
jgi:hypothetical protein